MRHTYIRHERMAGEQRQQVNPTPGRFGNFKLLNAGGASVQLHGRVQRVAEGGAEWMEGQRAL